MYILSKQAGLGLAKLNSISFNVNQMAKIKQIPFKAVVWNMGPRLCYSPAKPLESSEHWGECITSLVGHFSWFRPQKNRVLWNFELRNVGEGGVTQTHKLFKLQSCWAGRLSSGEQWAQAVMKQQEQPDTAGMKRKTHRRRRTGRASLWTKTSARVQTCKSVEKYNTP